MGGVKLINPHNGDELMENEDGLKINGKVVFPNIKGAYRIVEDDNYTENFGYQWNKFTETQVDKSSKLSLTKNRFFSLTNWDKEDLTGKTVLEVGSGAGRFTQIVLDNTNAELFSVDYSNAVEANYRNNGPNKRLHLYQASIYEMPFANAQFDKVFCFGVLQHTPDVEKSVKTLIEMTKPGGELAVDFYPVKGWWTKINAKYILRPYTKKLSNEKLLKKIDKNIDWMIKTYRFLSKAGLGFLTRFIPICDINGTFPANLGKEQLREWAVLDTFDMFSPQYDQPQKIATVVKWFEKYGMKDVWGGYVEYNGKKGPLVKGIKA